MKPGGNDQERKDHDPFCDQLLGFSVCVILLFVLLSSIPYLADIRRQYSGERPTHRLLNEKTSTALSIGERLQIKGRAK